MKNLMILCSCMFVADISASWVSRKQIASGLSKTGYEQSRQTANTTNFGKVYSDVNKARMENAAKNEAAKSEANGNLISATKSLELNK